MLFTLYICLCQSFLSVNMSAQEGGFGKMLRSAQAFCWNSKVCTHKLMSGLKKEMCVGLFVCCVKVVVNWMYVTVFIVCDPVHEVGYPCRCA